LYIYTFSSDKLQSNNLLSEVTAMSVNMFLTLRKQITIIQKTDKKIHDMSSAINEIDMEFKEIKNVNIETIGSLSQITRP
jgi:hypothetical protein